MSGNIPKVLRAAIAKILEQHLIVLGKTRSGKSSKLRVFVEYLLAKHEPVTIIDPKGDWWGLKLSADGKGPGFPIVIFGGKHCDVPINPRSGAAIAELVATGNRPALIVLKELTPTERSQWFVDFAQAYYRLMADKRWLVIDEVHNFAPKGRVLDPQAGKMLHWASKLFAECQGQGTAILAASQRPQKVHNDILTSCETLVACKVIHPADRGAYKEWVDGADPVVGKTVLQDVACLERPEAYVWSPEVGFGPERVAFPLFETFDSFKPHEQKQLDALSGWAEVDLAQVREHLNTIIVEAEGNDPKVLKKKIAELESHVLRLENRVIEPPPQSRIQAAEQTGYTQGYDAGVLAATRAGYEQGFKDAWPAGFEAGAATVQGHLKTVAASILEALEIRHHQLIDEAVEQFAGRLNTPPFIPDPPQPDLPKGYPKPPERVITTKEQHNNDIVMREKRAAAVLNGPLQPKANTLLKPADVDNMLAVTAKREGEAWTDELTNLEQRILNVLAELENVASTQPTRQMVALMVGYADVTTKSFRNALSHLNSLGFTQPSGGLVLLTPEGHKLAEEPARPRTTAEHQENVYRLLGGEVPRKILEPLISTYPACLMRTEVAQRAGYTDVTTKSFRNILSRLKSMGLIEYPAAGQVAVTEAMFL